MDESGQHQASCTHWPGGCVGCMAGDEVTLLHPSPTAREWNLDSSVVNTEAQSAYWRSQFLLISIKWAMRMQMDDANSLSAYTAPCVVVHSSAPVNGAHAS
jgi:aspartate carbamoyltransferase catalytic subunit